MTASVCACITAVASVIVAAIGMNVRKSNAKMEERAKLRQRESMLSLQMMDATLQLSVVASNALTGGKNNGNVAKAREAAEKAAAEFDQFMREVTAHEISK